MKLKKKRIILLVLVFVVGISVSTFAYLNMQKQQALKEETKQIMVLNRDIKPYETIGQNDLKVKDVLKDYKLEGLLTDRYDLVGKVAADYLLADEPVMEGLVTEKDKIKHIKFATLKTDYTRSGGAKIGDVVDIYKVTEAVKDIPSEVRLVGENAIVMSVTDSEGTSIEQEEDKSIGTSLGGATKKTPVQALKLAIDSRQIDVKNIVEGSVDGSRYVMVVKNTESGNFLLGGK